MTTLPVRRPAARVVPVNERGEVLLLVITTADGSPGLMSVGGGLEPGESPRETALRELGEEVGLTASGDDLIGPFHHGTHEWTASDGLDYVSESAFFALAVPGGVEVSFAGHRPDEAGFIVGHEWVAPADLVGDPRIRHRLLPHIAGMAVARVRGVDYVVPRRTARVLPVNARGEVLLVLSCDPQHPDVTYWCSIGGGIDGAETLAEAGVRELEEETGLQVSAAELGVPFDRTEVTFRYDGAVFVNDSSWFAVRLEANPAGLRNHDPSERILDYRWWSPAALGAEATAANPDLARLAAAAVARLAVSR